MELLNVRNGSGKFIVTESNALKRLIFGAVALVVFIACYHQITHSPPDPLGEVMNDEHSRLDQWWMPMHQKYVETAGNITGDVVFYGDSIFESLLGTSASTDIEIYMEHSKRAFDATFSRRKDRDITSHIFAIAADQTGHLLWRLHDGEIHPDHPPTVAVLLIGTNDVTAAKLAAANIKENEEDACKAIVPHVVNHVLKILRYIHKVSPKTKILLMGELPRGSGSSEMFILTQPSVYTAALKDINLHLEALASQDGRILYWECYDHFLTEDGMAIRGDLMPDGQHPMGGGAQLFVDCIGEGVDQLLPW